MNRRSIMIAAALLITAGVSTAQAQVPTPSVSIGVLAGANFANFSGSDANGASSRTGIVGGLSVDFTLANNFGLEIDGLYSQQGAKSTFDSGEATLKLDYVQIPVLARINFPTHSPVRPFITVGPSVGFRVKCEASSGGNTVSCENLVGQNAKSVDVSGVVGAGLGFKMGKQELSIGARYNMGFTKVFDGSNAKNKVISVLAGLSF
jgi:hypothetical protein